MPDIFPNYSNTNPPAPAGRKNIQWQQDPNPYPDPDGSGDYLQDVSESVELLIEPVGITVDGGGSALTTGSKGFFPLPYAGTILSVTLIADQVGSVLFDILKSDLAHVGAGASIVASDPPTLASAQTSTDAALTGWTTSLAAGDVLEYKISSVSTITRVTLILKVQRT